MTELKVESREAKMEFIRDERRHLNHEDRKAIALILHRHDPNCVKYSASGARICLNKLPDPILNNIYAVIRAKTMGRV